MNRYFAQITPRTHIVTRVVAAESLLWLVRNLGGLWVETLRDDTTQQYAAPGMIYRETTAAKFEKAD